MQCNDIHAFFHISNLTDVSKEILKTRLEFLRQNSCSNSFFQDDYENQPSEAQCPPCQQECGIHNFFADGNDTVEWYQDNLGCSCCYVSYCYLDPVTGYFGITLNTSIPYPRTAIDRFVEELETIQSGLDILIRWSERFDRFDVEEPDFTPEQIEEDPLIFDKYYESLPQIPEDVTEIHIPCIFGADIYQSGNLVASMQMHLDEFIDEVKEKNPYWKEMYERGQANFNPIGPEGNGKDRELVMFHGATLQALGDTMFIKTDQFFRDNGFYFQNDGSNF